MKTRLSVLLFVLAVIAFAGSCTKKTPTLNLLVWEGYADPSFVKAFEEQHHCKVSASYMGSSDELVAKLRGGSAGNYDVISPSSDVATSIAAGALAAPLGLDQDPELQTTLAAAHFPAAGAREGPGVRNSIHVGAGPADLRHNRFRTASR
jgi:spermidine/putrescine-binding protein